MPLEYVRSINPNLLALVWTSTIKRHNIHAHSYRPWAEMASTHTCNPNTEQTSSCSGDEIHAHDRSIIAKHHRFAPTVQTATLFVLTTNFCEKSDEYYATEVPIPQLHLVIKLDDRLGQAPPNLFCASESPLQFDPDHTKCRRTPLSLGH